MIASDEGKLEMYDIIQKSASPNQNPINSPFEFLESLTRKKVFNEQSTGSDPSTQAPPPPPPVSQMRYGFGSGSTAVTALITWSQNFSESLINNNNSNTHMTENHSSDSQSKQTSESSPNTTSSSNSEHVTNNENQNNNNTNTNNTFSWSPKGGFVGGTLYVANAGDSRCVLSRAGKAVELTSDHKPYNPGELARIVKAGGRVDGGRVKGDLNLSRALGDLQYKQTTALPPEEQMITGDPDISVTELTSEDEFLIIACDGIWDVKSCQQAVDFVGSSLKEGSSPSEVCEKLLNECLAPNSAGLGTDNMTAIVVMLKKMS
jgi:serine/threonine protein phosphatase PrpC